MGPDQSVLRTVCAVATQRSTASCFDFASGPLDKTFAIYLQILTRMRCRAPDLNEFLLTPDGPHAEYIEKDLQWRQKEPSSQWTPTSMNMHMQEFKSHRLRWDSIRCSEAVEASPDFEVGRGRAVLGDVSRRAMSAAGDMRWGVC